MSYSMIPVEHPDWLQSALPEVIDQLKIVEDGRLPAVLHGRFIHVACMRLLRCVYGSDLATAAAIRTEVLEDVEFWQRIDAMTPTQARKYFRELEQHARKP